MDGAWGVGWMRLINFNEPFFKSLIKLECLRLPLMYVLLSFYSKLPGKTPVVILGCVCVCVVISIMIFDVVF